MPEKALHLRRKLAMERQMMSLVEREMLAATGDIVFERESWVDAFIDYGHVRTFDGGRTRVFRGIERTESRLFWLVRREGKRFGYHSIEPDPLEAAEDADTAWRARRAIRQNWHQVEAVSRDLLTGRLRFRVHIDDAHASPLCSLGIRGFMRKCRLHGVREIPGRMAALLMRLDPQVGFVIHQAWLRHEGAPAEGSVRATPPAPHSARRRDITSSGTPGS